MRVSLHEFMDKYGIKRIDFEKAKELSGTYDTEYATDELICPYCGTVIECEAEETDDIINGTIYDCPSCEKIFRVEAEVSIQTECIPIENHIVTHKSYIESVYKHNDECDAEGMQWVLEEPCGYVEYETFKDYERPFLHNLEIDKKRGEEDA